MGKNRVQESPCPYQSGTQLSWYSCLLAGMRARDRRCAPSLTFTEEQIRPICDFIVVTEAKK